MRTETEVDLMEMLLRDQPPCTAAELGVFAIAFWDGEKLGWAWLKDDGRGEIERRFALDLDAWEELSAEVVAWLKAPVYKHRPELRAWMKR